MDFRGSPFTEWDGDIVFMDDLSYRPVPKSPT